MTPEQIIEAQRKLIDQQMRMIERMDAELRLRSMPTVINNPPNMPPIGLSDFPQPPPTWCGTGAAGQS